MNPSADSAPPEEHADTPPFLHPRKTTVLEAVCYALVIALIVVMGAAFIGGIGFNSFNIIIPPWPVSGVLLVGLITTMFLVALRRWVWSCAFAAAAVLASIWLLRPVVDLRAAEPHDRVYQRYFGIESYGAAPANIRIKNIAVVTGIFTRETWVSATLYRVKSGSADPVNGFTVGRTRNQIPAPHWEDMRITLALGDRNSAEGRITQLGSAGHARGSGGGGEAVNDVVPHFTKTLPGQFTRGAKRIVYVEGDAEIAVDETMTVGRFAQKNKGGYLVVEVQLH